MSEGPSSRPSAPGYAYQNAPPPSGYYAYAYPPQTTAQFQAVDYQHYYEPHGQSYGYNPYAFAPPPPQQAAYYPAPAQLPPSTPQPQIATYSFVRAEHDGWHVFDPHGSLIFDVTYKKAGWFEHDGCEVHHGEGGPKLATVYDEELTAGSFTCEIKRKSSHRGKMCFFDPHSRGYAFRETEDWALVIIYPSKETVAQGNVDINTGTGVLKIMDPAQAPDAPLLVAAYVELLRKQKSDQEATQAGINAGIVGAAAGA